MKIVFFTSAILCLTVGRLAAQGVLLGPPPEVPPPEDNLGELFPVEGAPPAEQAEPDLTPFPDRTAPSLSEWEPLDPPPPEVPDGMIIYQGPVRQSPPIDKQQQIETHDGFQEYSSADPNAPWWVLPAVGAAVLLLALATAAAIWRQRRTQ